MLGLPLTPLVGAPAEESDTDAEWCGGGNIDAAPVAARLGDLDGAYGCVVAERGILLRYSNGIPGNQFLLFRTLEDAERSFRDHTADSDSPLDPVAFVRRLPILLEPPQWALILEDSDAGIEGINGHLAAGIIDRLPRTKRQQSADRRYFKTWYVAKQAYANIARPQSKHRPRRRR